MYYFRDEQAWTKRKARGIVRELGWPMPIARMEAQTELVRTQQLFKSAEPDSGDETIDEA